VFRSSWRSSAKTIGSSNRSIS